MKVAIFSPMVGALLLLLLCSACSSGGGNSANSEPAPGGKSSVSAKLATVTSCGALETRLKAELTSRYQRQQIRYLYTGVALPPPSPTATPVPAPAGSNTVTASTDTSASSTYSTTNVQEQGVDEGDLVKTDGTTIYLARGSRFLILKALPAEQTAILSDIDLQEQITELHLSGSVVTIVTTPANFGITPLAGAAAATSKVASLVTSGVAPVATAAVPPAVAPTTVPVVTPVVAPIMAPLRPITRLYQYNVSVPAAPLRTYRYDFPGTLQGSRRVNDTIYLVSNYTIDLAAPVTPASYMNSASGAGITYADASARATAENLKRIEALTISDLLPSYSRIAYNGTTEGAPQTAVAVDCSSVYIPETGNGTDLSLVIALRSTTAAPVVTSSAVLSSWCRIYMSLESLYLASNNQWNWIEPLAGNQSQPVNPEPWTALHKFSVSDGSGTPLYRGSGTVDGWLNDQFSMGEYKGYLRLGTTRGGWWGESISNQLAILGEQNGQLLQTGSVTGLAPGERIYSMRFDRERGYMVTFRQTDPLFTFDLSNPAHPQKVGELKVNGFATYMQVIGQDSNRLLTIGRSADANGRVTGNKLQLFDVTNLATPRLLGDYELGSGWSDALFDHHAFLYYEPLNLLTLPYYSSGSSVGSYSSGLRVFAVDGNGIASRGLIAAPQVSSAYGSYQDTVDRALIIGSNIYSLAHRSVVVAGAAQLDVKKSVELPEGYRYYPAIGIATPAVDPRI